MRAACVNEAVQSIGNYTLLESLGEGCLGQVYRASDRTHDREVAIRVLSDEIRWEADLRERFLRECHAIAGLQHENIARIFEIGEEEKSPYIVMELLGGADLGSLIARKSALPVEKKLSIMIQVAEGLGHAHAGGVLHRRLKPGKIHLTPEGIVKIRDSGIAHVLANHLGRPGVRWGSPLYLSPEQIERKDCDERSDIFSAGIVFYELLTYSHPFHDPNSNKSVDRILFETHLPTIDEFPDAPPGIWAILKKCLAKNPDERYQTSAELLDECRELLKDLSEDSQLMLVELQSALPRLRRAAEQPWAPKGTVQLLHDIERLLGNDARTDYASLDRLMETLAEQYPAIQAVAAAPPALDNWPPELSSEKPPVALLTQPESVLPSSEPLAVQSDQASSEPSVTPALDPSGPERRSALPEEAVAPDQEPLTGDAASEPGLEDRSTGSEWLFPSADKTECPPGSGVDTREVAPADAAAPKRSAARSWTAAVRTLIPGNVPARLRPGSLPHRHLVIPQPAFRTAAALLSVLLIVVALYIAGSASASRFAGTVWSTYAPGLSTVGKAQAQHPSSLDSASIPVATGGGEPASEGREGSLRVLLTEARDLARQRRFEESSVLVRRILELNPDYEPAVVLLEETDDGVRSAARARGELQKGIDRADAFISAGMLRPARTELDWLLQANPGAPELVALRKRWERKNAQMTQLQPRKEVEPADAARLQKEGERAGRVAELLALGKYSEAVGALNLWIAENPASSRAQELWSRAEEARQGLSAYESAMAERKYADALTALGTLERINAADPNLAELRRRVETRAAAARAILTVHRLGERATLMLDGNPIGDNGEVESASVPIGNHTLAISNQKGILVSRSQEFLDGQKVVYVHDASRQLLRPMAEGELDLVAQRRAMEEVHHFAMEHDHGLLRGNCRGELLVGYFDVEFRPTSGAHGFRVPFKRVDARIQGKSVIFSFTSDGKDFQNLRAQDAQTALDFKQAWDRLKALGR